MLFVNDHPYNKQVVIKGFTQGSVTWQSPRNLFVRNARSASVSLPETLMIAAKCAECGHVHKVKDGNEGRKFNCRQCKATVKIPSPSASGGGGEAFEEEAACQTPGT